MKYLNYGFFYPPRPENAVRPEDLNSFDNNTMIAELKINGSNTSLYTNGDQCRIMGRHKQILSNFNISKEEIIENLYKPLNIGDNWLVINGEYLNKSKYDENNQVFNHKLMIFDILVFDSDYLVGSTFEERINLLDNMYGQKNSDKEYLYGISDNIYHVKPHYSDFKNLYDRYTPIDLVEGLVLKRKNARLELSNTERNNWRAQIKCRKPTRNYKF